MEKIHVKAVNVNNIYAHSHVLRYHTEPVRRNQNLAEHCFRVSLLAVKILHRYEDWLQTNDITALGLNWDDTELKIYRYALLHETNEVDSGDVPSHIKHKMLVEYGLDWNAIAEKDYWDKLKLVVPSPEPIVKAMVSLADTIEGKIFARYQIPEGNTNTQVVGDWNEIWNRKIRKFFYDEGILNVGFIKEVESMYYYDLAIDPAWV